MEVFCVFEFYKILLKHELLEHSFEECLESCSVFSQIANHMYIQIQVLKVTSKWPSFDKAAICSQNLWQTFSRIVNALRYIAKPVLPDQFLFKLR